MTMLQEAGETVELEGKGVHAFVWGDFTTPEGEGGSSTRWHDGQVVRMDAMLWGAGVMALMEAQLCSFGHWGLRDADMGFTGAYVEITERRFGDSLLYLDRDWYEGADWRYDLSPIKDFDSYMDTLTWMKQLLGARGVGTLASETSVPQPETGVYEEYVKAKREQKTAEAAAAAAEHREKMNKAVEAAKKVRASEGGGGSRLGRSKNAPNRG